MAIRIYLPEDLAEGKDVVRVNGSCYERVGPSDLSPDTFDVDGDYATCEECEDGGSSDSSSDGSSDSSDSESSGSTGSDSDSGSGCECTEEPLVYDGPGGSGGVSWIGFPPEVCVGDPELVYSFTLFDPGTLGGSVSITSEYQGGEVSGIEVYIDSVQVFVPVIIGMNEFSVSLGTSSIRVVTVKFSVVQGFGVENPCVEILLKGGRTDGSLQSVLEYPPR